MTGGIALAAVAFWFFKKQADRVVEGRADAWDDAIIRAIHRFDNVPSHRVMEGITFLGTHLAIITTTGLTAIALIRKGRREDAFTLAVSTGGGMIINTLLKNIFQRERPIEHARQIKLPRSHSFPSGHALLSAATYPIVVHHLVQQRSATTQSRAHVATAVLVFSIGFSRVYFGVHFPSDVLGGFAAGLAWLGLTSLSHSMLQTGGSIQPLNDV